MQMRSGFKSILLKGYKQNKKNYFIIASNEGSINMSMKFYLS